MPTRMTWVPRSAIARIRFSFEDSSVPRMFSSARPTTSAAPPITSPGLWPSQGQKTAR